MKNFFISFGIGLLVFVLIGGAVSLGFGAGRNSVQTNDETQGLHAVRFMVRGELHSIHHIQTGSNIAPPWGVDDDWFGWAIQGTYGVVHPCCIPIENDKTFRALIVGDEIVFEVDTSGEYLYLTQPVMLEFSFDGSTFNMGSSFHVGGRLEFVSYPHLGQIRHRQYLDGELIGAWWNTHEHIYIRGRAIV